MFCGPASRAALGACLVAFALIAGCTDREAPTAIPYFFTDQIDRAQLVLGDDATRAITSAVASSDVVTFQGETRRAVGVPFPSSLSYELQVPDNAVLRFAIGVSTQEQPRLLVPIGFDVRIDSDDGDELIFTEEIRRSQPNRWFPRELDLSRWSGTKVRLTFEVSRVIERRPRAEESVLPLWGNAILTDRTARFDQPNVILISIDCLRADHVGAYGYARDTTPNIDAFARDGVVFETAVAASSYTLPTHASMLTGVPPSLHGAHTYRRIASAAPYAPESLAHAGYRVSGVVSAPFLSQTYGFHRGFHTYRLAAGRGVHVVDQALDVLDEGSGLPQFFFLHVFDAHDPYMAPREYLERFGKRPDDITQLHELLSPEARQATDAEIEQLVALYDGDIAYVDAQVGRFLDELERRNLYGSSLIILTADHGEAFQEHGAWTHGQPELHAQPRLYDEILRVPLIVKWPDEKAGLRIQNAVSQMDVAATILDAARLPSSSQWAVGLRRYLEARSRPSPRRIISESVGYGPERGADLHIALRDRGSKYIATVRADSRAELYEAAPATEELYDLERDPQERLDLMREPGHDGSEFRTALRSYFELVRKLSPDEGANIELDDELREQLRALGYLDP